MQRTQQNGGPPEVRVDARSTFWLLAVAAFVAVRLPLPWGGFALLFIVPGLLLGTRLLTRSTGRRTVVVLGLILLSLLGFTTVSRLVFYPAQVRFEQCRRDALGVQAEAACQADLEKAINERMGQAS